VSLREAGSPACSETPRDCEANPTTQTNYTKNSANLFQSLASCIEIEIDHTRASGLTKVHVSDAPAKDVSSGPKPTSARTYSRPSHAPPGGAHKGLVSWVISLRNQRHSLRSGTRWFGCVVDPPVFIAKQFREPELNWGQSVDRNTTGWGADPRACLNQLRSPRHKGSSCLS
jgi:hypothetical protein